MNRDLTDPVGVADGVDLEHGLKEPLFENLALPEEFGPVQLVVDDHKIKRFAFTQDDYNPWYFSDKNPFGRRIAHAGLLSNDLVQLFTTKYKASHTVGLHTEEQLWFDNPTFAGEVVTLKGRYTEAYELRGEGYVVMEAQAVGRDGRSLIRHRGVEIFRTMPKIEGRGGSASPERRVTGTYDVRLPFVVTAGMGIEIGMPLEPLTKQLTQEQISVFSRLGEYVRNIHSDLDIARQSGLRIPIAQGQQQCCLIVELLSGVFGASWFTSGWLRTKFVQPVDAFADLIVGGVITALDPTDDAGRALVSLDVWVRRPDQKLSVVGWARCSMSLGDVAALRNSSALTRKLSPSL